MTSKLGLLEALFSRITGLLYRRLFVVTHLLFFKLKDELRMLLVTYYRVLNIRFCIIYKNTQVKIKIH